MKIVYTTEQNKKIIFEAHNYCSKCDIKDGYLYFCKRCDFVDKPLKRLKELHRRIRNKIGIKHIKVGRPKTNQNIF